MTSNAIIIEIEKCKLPSLTLSELAEQQGVKPIGNIDDLTADFWPEEDSIDDFLATLRKWRRQGLD